MPLDGEDREKGANKIGRVGKSLLFFANLVTAKESEEQKCQQKIEQGCFPTIAGTVFECRDSNTCPESAK